MDGWLEELPNFSDKPLEWVFTGEKYFAVIKTECEDGMRFTVLDFMELHQIGASVDKLGVVMCYQNAQNPDLIILNISFFQEEKARLRLWFDIAEYERDSNKVGMAFYIKDKWIPKRENEKTVCDYITDSKNAVLKLEFVSLSDPEDIRQVLIIKGRLS